MTLHIELSPELANRLEAEAARRGIAPGDLARSSLEAAFPPIKPDDPSAPYDPDDLASRGPITPEEWERESEALDRELADLDLPEIPMEALRRENLYEDRGL